MGQEIPQIADEAARAMIDEGHTGHSVDLCKDAWNWLAETYGGEDRGLNLNLAMNEKVLSGTTYEITNQDELDAWFATTFKAL